MSYSPDNFQNRVSDFTKWFESLDPSDQEELMQIVYNEHKVREVVRSFSSMPIQQRQTVFKRLGLPNELLTRISTPAISTTEVEVEWEEWDGSANA